MTSAVDIFFQYRCINNQINETKLIYSLKEVIRKLLVSKKEKEKNYKKQSFRTHNNFLSENKYLF